CCAQFSARLPIVVYRAPAPSSAHFRVWWTPQLRASEAVRGFRRKGRRQVRANRDTAVPRCFPQRRSLVFLPYRPRGSAPAERKPRSAVRAPPPCALDVRRPAPADRSSWREDRGGIAGHAATAKSECATRCFQADGRPNRAQRTFPGILPLHFAGTATEI